MIITYLAELINKRKNNDNKYRIQLSLGVNYMCITDKEKTLTLYVTNVFYLILLMNLLNPFYLIIRRKNKN